MANMSDWLEARLLSHIFGTGTFSKPATIAIALTSTVPNDTDTGASAREIANAGAYARQANANGAGAENRWTDAAGTGGFIWNLATITFPQATASWGYVSGILITDSATYAGGNCLAHGALSVPKLIDANDQLVIPISGIQVQAL